MLKVGAVGGFLQKAAGAGGDLVERAGLVKGEIVERAGGGAGGFLDKVRAKSDLDPLGAALRQLLNTESAAVPKEVLEDLCRRASEDQEGAGGRVARHIESHLKASSSQWRRIHGALALLDHALRICPADVEALGKWGLNLVELRTELRGLMTFDKDKDLRACKLVQKKATAVDKELERCGIPGPPTSPKPRPAQAAVAKPDTSGGSKGATSNGSVVATVTTKPITIGRLKFDELPTPQTPHSDSDKECEETDELYPSSYSPKKREEKEPAEKKTASGSLGEWGLKMTEKISDKIPGKLKSELSDTIAEISDKIPSKLSDTVAFEMIEKGKEKVIAKFPVREASLPETKATVVGKSLNDKPKHDKPKPVKQYSEEQHNLLGGVNVKKESLKNSNTEATSNTSKGKWCSSICRCFFKGN